MSWLMWLTLAVADVPERPQKSVSAWRADRPVSLGVRAGMWQANYTAPALGGHLKLRPWRMFGVELFADHFGMVKDGDLRHDHVIGFHAFVPLGSAKAYVAPTLGACTDFRFMRALDRSAPVASDIRFAPHTGVMGEVYLGQSVSLEATGTVYGYIGNDTQLDGWTAVASNRMHFSPVAQMVIAGNYTF